MNKQEKIKDLRHFLARYGLPPERPVLSLGVAGADAALGGGLASGALHEVYARDWAAGGFAACLAIRLAGKKPFFWVRPDYEALEYGAFNAQGLVELGLDARNLFLVRTANAAQALAAANDILSCPHVGVVLLELCGQPKALDPVAGRRLNFIAAEKGVTALLLHEGVLDQPALPTQTRWRVASVPSGDEEWGFPAYRAELIRNRLGPSGSWIMTWNPDNGLFRESARLAHAPHPGALVAAASHRPAEKSRQGARNNQKSDASLSDLMNGSGPPLVIAGRANNSLYVAALEERAQLLGLYKGQPLANARAMAPALTVRPAEEKEDAALLEGMAEWCDRFSPFVATDPPDGLILDITGAAHLFGGEAAMLNLVTQKIGAQGFAIQAAIAGTIPAARALARFAAGHIAAPGQHAESLKRLPVAALDADEKIIAGLKRAGLKTIGQVMGRGRDELAARFGKAFVAELGGLFGHDDRPLDPRRPLPDLMAEQRFAEPIVTGDAIAASLLSLAQSLGGILEQRGLSLRRLEAGFFRSDGVVRRISLRLGGASRDAERLMRLLQERLDTLHDPLDPGFGFDLIRLEAMLTERARAADSDFDSAENARSEIAYLADRLAARHGEARVLRFVPQDTHIPEAQSVGVPAQDQDFAPQPWTARRREKDPPLRPLRLFEKPEEIKVPFATAPDGPPNLFHWRRAEFAVARAEGPERIAMEWWRRERPTRDYFRVETRDGQRFWLYRDGLYERSGLAPRWYLHGIFA